MLIWICETFDIGSHCLRTKKYPRKSVDIVHPNGEAGSFEVGKSCNPGCPLKRLRVPPEIIILDVDIYNVDICFRPLQNIEIGTLMHCLLSIFLLCFHLGSVSNPLSHNSHPFHHLVGFASMGERGPSSLCTG